MPADLRLGEAIFTVYERVVKRLWHNSSLRPNLRATGETIQMEFLISTANAQAAGIGAGGSNMNQMLVMVALFGAFYFMLIRPQQKKAKEQRDMVSKLAAGDEVVTAGGILGRITAVGDTYLSVEVARDTTIQVQRYQVVQLLPKGTYKSA